MILTRSEAKTILQITATTYDDLIDFLLPIIEDDIRYYTNNNFIDESVSYNSNTISFDSTTNTISDSDEKFITNDFISASTYNVYGSKYNDFNVYASSVTSGTMTIDTTYNTLITESAENDIYIHRVVYPKGLKLIVAQMVNFSIKNIDTSIKSKKVDDMSVTYTDISQYPDNILRALNKYRKLRI